MELSSEDLEAIGRYVRGNLGVWMRESGCDRDPELHERMVRIEKQLELRRTPERAGRGIYFPSRTERQRNEDDPYSDRMNRGIDEYRRHMNRWGTFITVMSVAIVLVVAVSWFV